MNDPHLRDEINKRLTLNWLIQGVSQHTGMTVHHLVRDELTAIDPELLHLYDQFALVGVLQWWHTDAALVVGWPPRFWKRAASSPRNPFFEHPILSRHGGMLAQAARQRALDRCSEKRVTRYPFLFSLQAVRLMAAMRKRESPHVLQLIDLAKQTASAVLGIPTDRLSATLTTDVAFGDLSRPKTFRGRLLRLTAVGYGGVLLRGGSLTVVARAANWHLLIKELIKGTAELICLHGLNHLDDQTCARVTAAADRIEFEPWMLQTGGELWRRLLPLLPDDRPVSTLLMHLARLPPKPLESLILAVLEQPQWARELLQNLGQPEPVP